ncbi:low molecular weight phosphotyrosine protein phosphatase [Jeotgalibacillus sp. S-D1]|nr:low molecular weight phosphotyrosine protein phosphatase [Jeotgalibacillus sp. S-D1]
MKNVLFVCLGNICRSPMAEGIFRDLVEKEGMSHQISADSAGTSHWHTGKPPHQGTLDLLRAKGISTEDLTARQLVREDLESFDYIVGLDRSIMKDIEKLTRATSNEPEYILLLELIDSYTTDVPDPYYTGNFDEVYELLYDGCTALLNKLKQTI